MTNEEPKFPPIRILKEGGKIFICSRCNQNTTEAIDSGMCESCFIDFLIPKGETPVLGFLNNQLKLIEQDLKILHDWWIFGMIYIKIRNFIKRRKEM
jgi:hypothetical protein